MISVRSEDFRKELGRDRKFPSRVLLKSKLCFLSSVNFIACGPHAVLAVDSKPNSLHTEDGTGESFFILHNIPQRGQALRCLTTYPFAGLFLMPGETSSDFPVSEAIGN